jgi:hypothetical protein
MNPLERYLLWFVSGTLTALALAWIAFQIQQQQFAPAILFPLAVGGAFGGGLTLLNRAARIDRLPLLLGCAAAWALLLIVTQDYIGHRTRIAALDEQLADNHPLAAVMASQTDVRPTFGEHLAARVRNQPLWWSLDVIFVAAATCGVIALGSRRPI